MCARYALFQPEDLGTYYDVDIQQELHLETNTNVAPNRRMPILTMASDKRKLEEMQWGFVPVFSKDAEFRFSTINARAESVFDKPTWKTAIMRTRCIVPVSGYYEWREEDGKKQPYFFTPKEGEFLSLAGLYSVWHRGQSDELRSYTIITTESRGIAENIHDRMPLVISEDDLLDAWISPETNESDIRGMIVPPTKDIVGMRPVSQIINNVRNHPTLDELDQDR